MKFKEASTVFVSILAVSILREFFIAADKVEIKPPADLMLQIAEKYLKISDVILTTHENSSILVDDYAELFHKNNIFTSLFQWRTNISLRVQFKNFIKVVSSGRHYKIIFFLDYESAEVFLKQADKVRDALYLVCFYKWVFFDFEGVDISQLEHVSTSAVCWRTIFVTKDDYKESEDARFTLFGSTFADDGNCLLQEPIADWTSSSGFKNAKPFKKRITDYKGVTFIGSVLNEQPFYATTKEGNFEGMEYELLKTLRYRLNFKVKYVNNTDGDFGDKLPNGSWTGFIGLITRGECIFSLATLSISNRRMHAVDFTSPYIFGKLSFVIISPTLESRRLVLIKPLQPKVWTALGGTLVLCTLVLYLITHSLPCKSGVRRAYNIWFLLRTLGQQGTPSPAPARYSIRFFISGWWFFIMVILWSYAGTLTSFMTYPGRRPAIDTVKKLRHALVSQSIQYGTLKGTSYENFLKTDMSQVHPAFGQALVDNPDNLVKDVSYGMEKVLKGKYAFVYMKAILKWFAATLGFDRFRFSKNVFSTEAIGAACQKCHPLKKSFDHIIDRLEETGLFSKWYNDAFTKASIRAPQVIIVTVRALSLDDIQGAFYFLGISLTISTFVFLMEIMTANLIYRMRLAKKKRRKKQLFYVK